MKMNKNIECFDENQVIEFTSRFNDEENKDITETAGFVPLEVKMKQFEQNGIIAQFQVSDFDSNDYRDIYLNPDFQITPEDDYEDVQEKILARNEYLEEVKKSKQESAAVEGSAGTQEQKKNPHVADNEEE